MDGQGCQGQSRDNRQTPREYRGEAVLYDAARPEPFPINQNCIDCCSFLPNPANFSLGHEFSVPCGEAQCPKSRHQPYHFCLTDASLALAKPNRNSLGIRSADLLTIGHRRACCGESVPPALTQTLVGRGAGGTLLNPPYSVAVFVSPQLGSSSSSWVEWWPTLLCQPPVMSPRAVIGPQSVRSGADVRSPGRHVQGRQLDLFIFRDSGCLSPQAAG